MQLNVHTASLVAAGDFTDATAVWNSLLDCTTAAGLHIVGMTQHHFHPKGFSGVILLAESHVAVHTWPEQGRAWVEVATCGAPTATTRLVDELRKVWTVTSESVREVTA